MAAWCTCVVRVVLALAMITVVRGSGKESVGEDEDCVFVLAQALIDNHCNSGVYPRSSHGVDYAASEHHHHQATQPPLPSSIDLRYLRHDFYAFYCLRIAFIVSLTVEGGSTCPIRTR
jgi:hypothetical protein